MATFLTDLWTSVFEPGPTATLLTATNATFAALQIVLASLLLATHSIHFIVLSVLCGGLWYSINWFARELQAEKASALAEHETRRAKEKSRSPDPGSDTETETMPETRPRTGKKTETATTSSLEDSETLLKPRPLPHDQSGRRRSLGDSSGYVSTDSEWEKVSEGERES